MKLRPFFLICILFVGLLSGCTPQAQAQVAATTLPVYQFTSRLCEDTGISVARLVTESVSCLHDYSLNVSQVRAIEAAQVVVLSGAGLEEFLDDALDGAQAVIDSSEGISLIECHEGHHHEEESYRHHEADPHIWLSPANAKIMAENICAGLCVQFPEHTATFETNLAALIADIDALSEYGEAQLSDLQCRELITFHDGFAYFADTYDLSILEAVEEESGSEASAQELIHLIDTIQAHALPAIFTEQNGSVSAAQIIAAETGVKSFALDMAMAGDDWFSAMYHNIDTVKEALG